MGTAQTGTTPGPKKSAADISDNAVRRATGHGWEERFHQLDAFGAGELDQQSVAAKLGADYPLSGWWCQKVTGRFERARGRRARKQACDGSFSTNSSKTIAVPLAKLYARGPTRNCARSGCPMRG